MQEPPTERGLLPPYPNGWYALELSQRLAPGATRALTFMGQEIVLFRTRSGRAAVVDAYCAHLGAHLGFGGSVVGECIRCPFHGFQYGVDGQCTLVPYGTKAPPLARLRTLPLRELHGVIIAYHDADGLPPSWEVPDLDTAGWSPLRLKEWRLRGHPQETSENSVDIGHFSQIHQYTDVQVLKDATVNGPHLNATYAMVRPAPFIRIPIATEFDVHVHGLGYSMVDVRVAQFGVRARLFVFATPTDGRQIVLRIALSVRRGIDARRVHPLATLVPRRLLEEIIARATYSGIVHDVEQDFVIWKHKKYVQPPILAAGDGPVGKYRQWAKQFYRGADVARV